MRKVNSVHAYNWVDADMKPAGRGAYTFYDISELPEWLAERVAVANLLDPETLVNGVMWYEVLPGGPRRYRVILTPEDKLRWKK